MGASEDEELERRRQLALSLRKKMNDKKSARTRKTLATATSPKQLRSRKKETVTATFFWAQFHTETNLYKTVPHETTGGERAKEVAKSCKKYDLLKQAKDFYFPGGQSVLGNESEFIFDISLDCHGFRHMASEKTVEELAGSIRHPRIYLLTRFIDEFSEDDDLCPVNVKCVPATVTSKSSLEDENKETQANMNIDIQTKSKAEQEQGPSHDTGAMAVPTEPIQSTSKNDADGILKIEEPTSNNSEESDGVLVIEEPIPFTSSNAHGEMEENIYDTVQNSPPAQLMEGETLCDTLLVHRGMVFKETLNYFIANMAYLEKKLKNVTLNVKMILPNGSLEEGEAEGVRRDMLSEFWDSFRLYTNGNSMRVPRVVHDMMEEEWRAIALVMCFGYLSEDYLPSYIAPSFLKACISEHVSDNDLMKDFLELMEEYNAEVVKEAMESGVIDKDVVVACGQYQCKKILTQKNLKSVLIELAHQELLQKPAFMIKMWHPIITAHILPGAAPPPPANEI